MNFRNLSLAVAAAFAVSTTAAIAAPITIPAGTSVSVALTAPLSSDSAAVGQSIAIVTAEAVTVGSRVVVPKGAHGVGVVKKVAKAKKKSAGEITVAFTYVLAADGTKVALSEIDHSASGKSEKGKANTAAVVATIALGPVGLFAHNMVKGKDVTIDPTQHLPAFVDANTKVNVK